MIPQKIVDKFCSRNKNIVSNNILMSLNKDKRRPLGRFNLWAWGLEPVRGCNLSCWHCPVQYFQKEKQYMTVETWINVWKIIRDITPYCRVELANSGEPTLHPNILEFIFIARRISPNSQIQITTNGKTLIQKKITYSDLFESGVNIVYVDMYDAKEDHIALAKESGYNYFEYYKKNNIHTLNAWTFHNDPKIKFIVLSEIPDDWPRQKINRGGLGTFLNNINFNHSKAKKLNVKPVTHAPIRRCNQPIKYVQVMVDGTYLMCCQDAFNKSNMSWNVNNGVEGFFQFWFSSYMQKTRKLLFNKLRNAHSICKKCSIIFSRCDIPIWKDQDMFNCRLKRSPIHKNKQKEENNGPNYVRSDNGKAR